MEVPDEDSHDVVMNGVVLQKSAALLGYCDPVGLVVEHLPPAIPSGSNSALNGLPSTLDRCSIRPRSKANRKCPTALFDPPPRASGGAVTD